MLYACGRVYKFHGVREGGDNRASEKQNTAASRRGERGWKPTCMAGWEGPVPTLCAYTVDSIKISTVVCRLVIEGPVLNRLLNSAVIVFFTISSSVIPMSSLPGTSVQFISCLNGENLFMIEVAGAFSWSSVRVKCGEFPGVSRGTTIWFDYKYTSHWYPSGTRLSCGVLVQASRGLVTNNDSRGICVSESSVWINNARPSNRE